MKKMILTALTILTLTIGMTIFIMFSNDHRACETSTVITFGATGEKITTETHICKEQYNM